MCDSTIIRQYSVSSQKAMLDEAFEKERETYTHNVYHVYRMCPPR